MLPNTQLLNLLLYKSMLIWEKRMNKEQAMEATKIGAISACISGIITLVFGFYAIWNNSSGILGIWNNPAIFFDVILIFIFAYGIYKKSVTAAVLMFVYFFYGKIYIALEAGQVSGIFLSLVFLYFFGKAIQGTLALRKIKKAEKSNLESDPKWIKVLIITCLVILFFLASVGMLTMTGTLTPTKVLQGKDLSKDYKNALLESDIINKGDSIEYFYSEAFSSITETGSILTNDRVIMYFTDENNEIAVYELYFENITGVELIKNGNYFNDSVYRVNAGSRDAYLTIVLSTENRGDIKFIESLRSKLNTIE